MGDVNCKGQEMAKLPWGQKPVPPPPAASLPQGLSAPPNPRPLATPQVGRWALPGPNWEKQWGFGFTVKHSLSPSSLPPLSSHSRKNIQGVFFFFFPSSFCAGDKGSSTVMGNFRLFSRRSFSSHLNLTSLLAWLCRLLRGHRQQ